MRDLIWYVTLDEEDYLAPGEERGQGHLPNLTRLRAVAERDGLRVAPVYMDDVTDERLTDSRLLALFGAGSFPEWSRQASDARWKARLDRYAATIRAMTVPLLAVCGTHQFVAAAFHGWEAVAHLTPRTTPPVTIAEELADGTSRIPRPRPGEVGVFPLRRVGGTQDPILDGLPDALRFVQYHRDHVLPGRHPAFTSLLEPDPAQEPVFWLPDSEEHHNPAHPTEYAPVQLLRLDHPDRLLYTAQFHPELPSGDAAVDAIGERLLRNFFALAAASR